MRKMDRKIAVKEKAGEGQIGVLASWTIGSIEVPVEVMEKWWENQTVLPDYLMPSPPSPADAFANACSQENVGIWKGIDEKIIASIEKDYGKQVRTQYLTLPTKDGSQEYVLTRRLWIQDEQEEITPEHPNVARLKFDNQTDKIEVIPFPDFKKSKVVPVIEKIINDEYQRQKGVVNGTRHRQAMYRLTDHVNGVPYGYGQGTAFIPNAGMGKLKAFQEYILSVAEEYHTTDHRCGFMLTTVIDAEEERKNILESARNEVQKRYEKLLNDTATYLSGLKENLSEKRVASVEKRIEERMGDMQRLGVLKAEYEAMLGEKIRVEQMVLDLPPQISGRAKSLAMQMVEACGNGVVTA